MGIKIFVISLLNHERRTHIQKQFDMYDIPFEFFDAVDGRNGMPIEYEKYICRDMMLKRVRHHVSDVEFAVSLSHHLAYRKIIDENISHALVLEDDVILTNAFKTFVNMGVYEKNDWDMVLLYHKHAYIRKNPQKIYGIKYYDIAFMPFTAAGYYINNTAAQVLLQVSTPVQDYADWPAEISHKIKVKVVYPRILQHPERQIHQSCILPALLDVPDAVVAYSNSTLRKVYDIASFRWYYLNRHRYKSVWDYMTRLISKNLLTNISPDNVGDRIAYGENVYIFFLKSPFTLTHFLLKKFKIIE